MPAPKFKTGFLDTIIDSQMVESCGVEMLEKFSELPEFRKISIGIHLKDTENGTVDGNTIDNFDIGIKVEGGRGSVISNNIIRGGNVGIQIGGGAIRKPPPELEIVFSEIGEKPYSLYTDEQLKIILDSLRELREEILQKDQVSKTKISRSLRYLRGFFADSANILVSIQGLAFLYGAVIENFN